MSNNLRPVNPGLRRNEVTFTFTATDADARFQVPYLEDARADFAPYYDVRDREPRDAQNMVITELVKLGASAIIFREGFFGTNPKRYGYLLTFQRGLYPAQMEVAGLPMKSETPNKIARVRIQALYVLRDWLKAAVTSQIFQPGSDPLVQFLLIDGKRTLSQVLIEDGHLPNINPLLDSGNVVEGNWSEDGS
jgi:hypothetical protein